MGALLALASAVSYGLSDFFGGVLSRRVSFFRVALLGQVGGLVSMALLAPALSTDAPAAADLVWGAVSGFGTGVAMLFLFRGVSRGAMSIVVPTSAVGGVALPILVGVAVLGERPELRAWVGIVIVLPALWSVSQGKTRSGHRNRPAVGDGLISGAGMALQYLALAQAGPESGIWAVVAGRVTSIAAIAVAIVVTGQMVRHSGRLNGTDVAAGGVGALAGLALAFYLYATRTELVSVAVVLSSLYPVIPVLLGITVLRERLSVRETSGLVAVLAATVLIATA